MHVLCTHHFQYFVGFMLGHCQNDLHRLVSEFKNMRGMMSTCVPDAFRCTDDGRPSNTAFANLLQKPFTKRQMTAFAILLSVERQLIAVHTDLHGDIPSADRTPPLQPSCVHSPRRLKQIDCVTLAKNRTKLNCRSRP